MMTKIKTLPILACLVLLALAAPAAGAEPKAKNVILFLADAGGIPTIHAASVHGYGDTRKLFIQSMTHIGLSDTSTASNWVTDSAAGMTAIVTGQKTHNGVVSQGADAVRGQKDGTPLKTILEYAEERGLSTGIITNVSAFDATPAACYAQVNDRRAAAKILQQFLNPRFGDGVDILIGAGRQRAIEATREAGFDFFAQAAAKGYRVVDRAEDLSAGDKRVVALFDSGRYALEKTLELTIQSLSRNPKGYFLMVEWDAHTNRERPAVGLDHVVEMDRAIARTARQVNPRDTLLLFTADHSFDLRLVGGRRGEPLIAEADSSSGAQAPPRPTLKIDGSHSGEEVLVAAQGPGASQVRGYLDNTRLFHIMMDAFGWKPSGR